MCLYGGCERGESVGSFWVKPNYDLQANCFHANPQNPTTFHERLRIPFQRCVVAKLRL